jgi:hypothetical protein
LSLNVESDRFFLVLEFLGFLLLLVLLLVVVVLLLLLLLHLFSCVFVIATTRALKKEGELVAT